MQLHTSISYLEETALTKQAENDRFVQHLKQLNEDELDAEVNRLDALIEPQISCTDCGNCCKGLMVNITAEEANKAAAGLHMSREDFDEKYVEKGSHELMIINSIPCHFLSDNKCTIYEYRFAGCKEFPALHLPHFNQRLFTVMMHYDRCPIIFNVMEELKKTTHFEAVES